MENKDNIEGSTLEFEEERIKKRLNIENLEDRNFNKSQEHCSPTTSSALPPNSLYIAGYMR